MDVSANTNLIPYSQRQYPVQAYIPEKTAVMTRSVWDSIEHHNRPKQPHEADAIHLHYCGNRYDSTQCLHYADDYQVGRRIDLYA